MVSVLTIAKISTHTHYTYWFSYVSLIIFICLFVFVFLLYLTVVDVKLQKIDIVSSNHITFSHAQKKTEDEAMCMRCIFYKSNNPFWCWLKFESNLNLTFLSNKQKIKSQLACMAFADQIFTRQLIKPFLPFFFGLIKEAII